MTYWGDVPIAQRLDELEAATQFTCPSIALAEGFRGRAGASTYVYRFDRVRAG